MNLFARLFLRTAIPFGVIMGIALGLERGWRAGLFGGVLAGLIFGIVMSLFLGVLQRLATRKTADGEDTAPSQSKTVPIAGYGVDPNVVLNRAVDALRKMSARIERKTARDVRATTGWTWKSFGEIVTVTVQENEMVAVITSVPKISTTMVDYGKGKQNVERLAAAIRG